MRRKNIKDWEILLPTVEMVINSLPNQSTGFSPFYLNYGHEPVTPIQLLKGEEFAQVQKVWTPSYEGSHPTGNWQEKICKGQ